MRTMCSFARNSCHLWWVLTNSSPDGRREHPFQVWRQLPMRPLLSFFWRTARSGGCQNMSLVFRRKQTRMASLFKMRKKKRTCQGLNIQVLDRTNNRRDSPRDMVAGPGVALTGTTNCLTWLWRTGA